MGEEPAGIAIDSTDGQTSGRCASAVSAVPTEVLELLDLDAYRLSALERTEVLGALERLIRRHGLGWVRANARMLKVRYRTLFAGR